MCAVAVTVTTPSGTSSGPRHPPRLPGPDRLQPERRVRPRPPGAAARSCPRRRSTTTRPAPVITSVSPAFASENGGSVDVITGSGFNLLTFEYANVGPAGLGFSQDFDILGVTPTQLTIGDPVRRRRPPWNRSRCRCRVRERRAAVQRLASSSTRAPRCSPASPSTWPTRPSPGHLQDHRPRAWSDVTSVVFQAQGDARASSPRPRPPSPNQTDTSLTVAIPQIFEFPVDVLACSATGCSATDPTVDTLLLVYAGRPVVNSSSPASGPAHGGTMVTIQGALDSEVTDGLLRIGAREDPQPAVGWRRAARSRSWRRQARRAPR